MSGIQRLISVDSHFHTTDEQLRAATPAKYHNDFDRAVRATGAARAAAMFERGGPPLNVSDYLHEAAKHPGYGDPVKRLEAMDDDGVDVEILFGDLSAFRYIYKMVDGWKATSRAMIDISAEFAGTDPKRLVVAYQLPLVDIDYALKEAQRLVTEHHARTFHLPTKPSALGLPDYFDERYDPLWSLLCELETPVCLHLGVEDEWWEIAKRDPTPQMGVFTSQPSLRLSEELGMLLLSGLLERFPRLKFVFVEPGLGWVPFYLDQLDRMTAHGYTFPALKGELPSYYFHRQVSLTFMDDRRGIMMRDEIGVENIMWSSDFPHPTTSWPNSREVVTRLMDGIPTDEAYAMVYGNAARIFNL